MNAHIDYRQTAVWSTLSSLDKGLLASNVFVMTAVTAESPQPQFRASPHASWLPRLHLFFAVVL